MSEGNEAPIVESAEHAARDPTQMTTRPPPDSLHHYTGRRWPIDGLIVSILPH